LLGRVRVALDRHGPLEARDREDLATDLERRDVGIRERTLLDGTVIVTDFFRHRHKFTVHEGDTYIAHKVGKKKKRRRRAKKRSPGEANVVTTNEVVADAVAATKEWITTNQLMPGEGGRAD
jgi:hypothetical protein